MMKHFLIFLLLTAPLYGVDNPYSPITERNAFELTSKEPAPILPPIEKILAPNVFLTGITRWKGTNKVHLVLRKAGETDRFVSLGKNERQYNIELKKVLEDSVLIETNGSEQLLSFKTNGLPTIVTKAPAAKKTFFLQAVTHAIKKRTKKKKRKALPLLLKRKS